MNRLRVLILLLALPSLAHAGLFRDCLRLLGAVGHDKVNTAVSAPRGPWTVGRSALLFNGIAVTGKAEFPEAVILNNLDFIPDQKAEWTADHFDVFKGRRILSLGEGTSSMVLMLRKNGFSARAMDSWYGRSDYPAEADAKDLHWFLKQYDKSPEALLPGDARKVPLADESEDLIFSHQLMNNLTMADRKRVLMETIRVASKGGEIRHYGFSTAQLEKLTPFLKATYGDSIEVSLVRKQSTIMDFNMGRMTMDSMVIVIRKKASSETPNVVFTEQEEKPDVVVPVQAPLIYRGPIQVRGLN